MLLQQSAIPRTERRGLLNIEQKSTTMDSERYYEIVTQVGGLLDSVKRMMPWLKGEEVTVQHDGATPHTGKGNEEKLKKPVSKMDGKLLNSSLSQLNHQIQTF
jgi:hypothetical protein